MINNNNVNDHNVDVKLIVDTYVMLMVIDISDHGDDNSLWSWSIRRINDTCYDNGG